MMRSIKHRQSNSRQLDKDGSALIKRSFETLDFSKQNKAIEIIKPPNKNIVKENIYRLPKYCFNFHNSREKQFLKNKYSSERYHF